MFQQDNDHKYTSKLISEWLFQTNILPKILTSTPSKICQVCTRHPMNLLKFYQFYQEQCSDIQPACFRSYEGLTNEPLNGGVMVVWWTGVEPHTSIYGSHTFPVCRCSTISSMQISKAKSLMCP